MPEIVDIRPKDVYATVDFSVAELKKIKTAMDISTVNFDGNEPEQVEAKNYYLEKFYPFIVKLLETIEQ